MVINSDLKVKLDENHLYFLSLDATPIALCRLKTKLLKNKLKNAQKLIREIQQSQIYHDFVKV